MVTENPFIPDFGQRPPVLAGRDDEIGRLCRALAAGAARKEFTTLMLGPRGVGKTTLMAAIADEARAAGWRVIRADAPLEPPAGQGTIAKVSEKIHGHLDEIDPPPKRRLTGASLPVIGGGAAWASEQARTPTFEGLLELLVDTSVAHGGAGVLLAVDEFHNLSASEASQIAGALQQITKVDRKNLAFVGVGLPHIEHTLLVNEGFTFFQRCHRDRIANISVHDAMDAIGRPLAASGRTLGIAGLRRAAAATRGLGFAIQSIGYHLWELAGSPPTDIAEAHIEEAVARMNDDVAAKVTTPIWSRLTPTCKLFLYAMLDDDGPTRLRDIGERLGTAAPNTSAYKKRLLDQGAIVETDRGRVTFASSTIRFRAIEERDLDRLIDEREAGERAQANAATGNSDAPVPIPTSRPTCDEWMPRAEANCTLRAGHRGSHRRDAPDS